MISWTKLLTGQKTLHDKLRFTNINEHVPKILVWNLTSVCNLNCKHCYMNAVKTKGPNEITTEVAKEFIDDLSEFRLPVLLFSGGEPLMREDIFELGKYAAEKGIRTVLSTNGTLITRDNARKLKESGFSYIGVSLDGLEKTNDEFRGKIGAFEEAIKGIDNCRLENVRVGLRFTISKYNFRDLPDIFKILITHEIPRICLYHLVYTGRGHSISDQDLTHEEKRECMQIIWDNVWDYYKKGINKEVLTVDNHADGIWIYLKLKKENPELAQKALELLNIQGGNSAGMKMACVDFKGNIYADQFLRKHPVGNIYKEKFSKIWLDKNNVFLNQLRDRKQLLKGRCSTCGYINICNGNFRARAEGCTGDLWGSDPACYLTDEEIKKNEAEPCILGNN